MTRILLSLIVAAFVPLTAAAQPATFPSPVEGDFIARDFAFASGERMAEVKIHYRTVGTPRKDADGVVRNGVLILHGTGGTGAGFLGRTYGGLLFGKGQPLDAERFFIILPDNIGHGGSSKPSDGMRMRFPKYDYDDMIEAQHRMLIEGLGITHLRLIMGTSMGCMQSFVWGETYADFASALMPLACEPIQIAGLNRMWRQLAINGIEADPAWLGGNYSTEPLTGMRAAENLLFVAGAAPLYYQAHYPTR